MLNLSFHGENEENTKVQDKDRVIDTNMSIMYIGSEGLYGTSKNENQVHTKAMAVARVAECQNLNSGNLVMSGNIICKLKYLLMKGRNSSSCFVGKAPEVPSSDSWSASSCSREGSNLGVRKARNRLRRYIPSE
jgi:hypothetical protein